MRTSCGRPLGAGNGRTSPLSASLGILTTAEGVETVEQLERRRLEGCDDIQGYLVSRPRTAPDLARMLGWPALPPVRIAA